MGYFGNKVKAEVWFYISNPELKGMRPIDYKIGGTWDALEKRIVSALKEYNDERTKSSSST